MLKTLARISPLARLGLLVAAVIIALDQATKWFVYLVIDLPTHLQINILPPIFRLSLVWNEGISFGLFGSGSEATRWFLSLFAIAVSGVIGTWLLSAERRLLVVGLGFVLGGALGNVIDRFVHGRVFDFLDFSGLGFPWVFNVADSAITIGVVLLVYDSIFDKRTPNVADGGQGGTDDRRSFIARLRNPRPRGDDGEPLRLRGDRPGPGGPEDLPGRVRDRDEGAPRHSA